MKAILSTLVLLLAGSAGEAAPPDLAAVWKDLTQNDEEGTKKAWQGMEAMIASPQQTIPFLKERVKPTPLADQKRIDECLADLDSKNFKKREKAVKDLEALGPLAVAALDR